MRRAVALALACACCVGEGDTVAVPPPAQLVREGARPVIDRRGDLDGDGTPEVVLVSLSEDPQSFGLPTPYLEVFAYRDGAWRRVFDATTNAPAGEGTPVTMLEASMEGFASGQTVDEVELVDLAGDGSKELVVVVTNLGATAGPLDLWVVSMSSADQLRAEYYLRTDRGGQVTIAEGRVVIEFGVYRRNDPGCCPSTIETRTIGYDPATDGIGVLERDRRRTRAA